jgi:hypothetical protein
MLKRLPEPDEAVITTPKWALERAAEIGAATAATVAATGVNVIGDLGSLSVVPDSADDGAGDPPLDPALPASAAAVAIVGTLLAGRGIEWPVKRPKGQRAPPVPALDESTLDGFSGSVLIRTALSRATRRVSRKGRARVSR